MAVYVDELHPALKQVGVFKKGTLWCHLTADTVKELHEFALKLGMKRQWFQPSKLHPHYDLVKTRREQALRLGAKFIPAMTQAKRRLGHA